ncbi:ADP-ribosylglycohydrolase family protein [Labilibacter marinus]|uniref:ADP-ribosylglycohydrolase family protein n=1 Tax=Labilibacter marinus TaxID=1477105 RepID=UPI0009500A5D|nr:ADP-ribosylglycohydrolase family protein [Labilibacter marinus]
MKGAIIGDIIGSAFVNDNKSSTDFQLFKPISSFTHDTILTLSTADSISNQISFEESLKKWVKKYPYAGYRSNFIDWVDSNSPKPYFSSGDGAARRISPIGLAAKTLEEALIKAEETTYLTHNNPEKIKASKAVTAAIFLAKNGKNKQEISDYISENFNYNLSHSLTELHDQVIDPNLTSPAPIAISIFINSDNFEDAIRKAISIGGPSNTIASITGGIAHAYYKHIPRSIIRRALNRLTPEMQRIIDSFEDVYLQTTDENKEILINLH